MPAAGSVPPEISIQVSEHTYYKFSYIISGTISYTISYPVISGPISDPILYPISDMIYDGAVYKG